MPMIDFPQETYDRMKARAKKNDRTLKSQANSDLKALLDAEDKAESGA